MEDKIIKNFAKTFDDIKEEIKKVIVGQDNIVEMLLIGILACGNVLMEGAPGLGKTKLVKTLSKVLDLSFARIQFTPDLMPQDILGTEIINKAGESFNLTFQQGPIFNSIVLADEINRASPKTQSALLEAMEERTVTVGNKTYDLPKPFFVLATENPLEMEGTYPLPEAQLDRFMFKINISLPDANSLSKILDLTTTERGEFPVTKKIGKDEILMMQKVSRKVPIASHLKEYVIKLMMATYPEHTEIPQVKEYVKCGVSPRGIQSVVIAAKVKALREGRFNVSKGDIKQLIYPCFRHRMFLNFKASADKISSDYILGKILKKVD